jgi:cell wall-associated NlpC family hydrolase
MTTTRVDRTKSAAKKLEAQQNATEGLKGLVVAVRNYIILCVDLLGSGDPAAAPDFSELITKKDDGKDYKSLTDTSDKSKLTTAYNQNVDRIDKVSKQLADQDGDVEGRVHRVADIAASTRQQIEGAITTLQNALNDPKLPAPPHHEFASEGTMINACLTAIDNVHTDVLHAHTKIQQPAKQIANTNPPVVPTGGSATQNSPGFAPVSYGTPLSSSQVQSMVTNVTDAKKKKFLETALAQVGDPYVWGAEGPNAFDCSGLVQYSAKQAGITNIPRTADAQYHATMSHPVNPSSLQPGDLIFPNAEFNGGNPGHVMIYVGNGQVVEAPHTGDHVKVIKLSQVGGFHATRF